MFRRVLAVLLISLGGLLALLSLGQLHKSRSYSPMSDFDNWTVVSLDLLAQASLCVAAGFIFAGLLALLLTSKAERGAKEVRCRRCAYDLRALPIPRCPECGLAYNERESAEHGPKKGSGANECGEHG